MPPRLPSRQCVELAQLGFLLPWMGRPTSHTLSASSGTSSTNHAESSRMALVRNASTAVYTKSLSRQQNQHSTLTRQYNTSLKHNVQPLSIINEHLSSPNPPPPSTLLTLLQADLEQLTISSGKALSQYCIRMGDLKTYRAIWNLMGKKRVISASLVRKQLSQRIPFQFQMKRKVSESNKEKLYVNLSSTKVGDIAKSKNSIRPNIWAVNMYPPLPVLSSKQYTKQELINHIHHLILQRESPDFQESLGLLKLSVDWKDVTLNKYENLGLLHLYLAYNNKLTYMKEDRLDGLELVYTYLEEFKCAKINKQTLHLLVKSIISIPSPSATVTQLDSLENRMLAIISYFLDKFKITPGPETFRILAKFAFDFRLDKLAEFTWEGWNNSLNELSLSLSSSQNSNPYIRSPSYTSPAYSTQYQNNNPNQDLRIRFKRIGNKQKRWTNVIRSYEEIGWIIRSQEEVGVNRSNEYSWLGEQGRLEKLAYQTQLQKENEQLLVEQDVKVEELNKSLAGLMVNNNQTETEMILEEIQQQLGEKQSIINNQGIIQTIEEEIIPNLVKAKEESPETIETINKEGHLPIEVGVSANITSTDTYHEDSPKTPYFVIIRDGSTVKIRSKNEDQESGFLELDGIDDKPVWE
ncbi:uncharacterized protein L201_005726 [Kwoniella dendrophila CBS 6074]|uniref:Uncharacterized protein n=1 Tax=Kwoniella dendrophila CBS 6074 TaxID=1295534 RepID=A0AAX4K0Y0_9TREE